MRIASLFLAALVLSSVGAAAQEGGKPIALHPENPHYFLFRGKPTVLVGSTEHYGAVLNREFDYGPYLEAISKDGLNLTRTFSGTYREIPDSFGITDNTLSPRKDYACPWARAEGGKFDLSKFDEAYFARLKDFVTKAGERGVVVEYVLFCTLYNDALWGVNAMNPKNAVGAELGDVPRREVFTMKHAKLLAVQEAFVRKAVEELNGFDNVYFEICNEPYFEGVSDEWQAHMAQVIAEAERGLPNRHLIAQNIANDRKKLEKVTKGVSILNFHYATPPETVAMNYGLGVVVSDDETGFVGKEDVHYRTEGWDFVMAGGAAYDNLDYSFTPGHPDGTLSDFKSPGGGGAALRRSLGALRRFAEGLDLVHMKPMNGVVVGGKATVGLARGKAAESVSAGHVTTRVLGRAGEAYAVYVRGGTGVELKMELAKGNWRVEWVETKTGEVAKEEKVVGGGVRTLVSPAYEGDVAVRARRVE